MSPDQRSWEEFEIDRVKVTQRDGVTVVDVREAEAMQRGREAHETLSNHFARQLVIDEVGPYPDAKLLDLKRMGVRNPNGSKLTRSRGGYAPPLTKAEIRAIRKAARKRRRDGRRSQR
jgi:hypothetical protein